jgi:effector-binding domain-containing protein
MRNMLQKIFFHTIVLMASMTGTAMAVEEAQYQVIRTDDTIEIREYAPSIVAETVVNDDFESAGNRAFRKLFNYISGDNSTADKIAMTAPVTQQKKQSEKIAMTAPVGQRATPDGWAVSFMMPASYTMETIPQPDDPAVVLRHIPEYRAVAIRYSGFWSEKNYAEQLEKLQAWISKNQLETTGPPVWARYNAPFTPWFMRRNEILVPIL